MRRARVKNIGAPLFLLSIIIENGIALCYNLTMNYAKVKSYAKINLTLDLLGVSGGYHMLDSVVASVGLYDLITAKKRSDELVGVYMHGEGSECIPYGDNNAAKAAERFVQVFGTSGADINVWKNIPLGAGLGGSSADVAGVLNAMAKLYGVQDFKGLKGVADSLGSDCGYMLTGGYARLFNRGEYVIPVKCGSKLNIGLLIPDSKVSTAECYAAYDRLPVEKSYNSENAAKALISGNLEELGKSLVNGLTCAAKSLNGDIGRAFDELMEFAPLGVNMTGSGSCVYALFENDQFLQYAKSRYRGKFRFIPTQTVIISKED